MNIIYIKKHDKQEFLNNYKQFLIDGKSQLYKTSLYKKDKRHRRILHDIFPNVLASLITEYDMDVIDVEYKFNKSGYHSDTRLQTFALYIWINQYDFELSVFFTYRPKQEFYEEVVCANFVMKAFLENESFGCTNYEHVFYHFNKFMSKYYNRHRYFDNFFNSYDVSTEFTFTNAKALKYCIIATKLITDVIQYNNREYIQKNDNTTSYY